jgi:GT2 family glycosyltransferase
MAHIDLSIIIVTWNTASITLKCVQTIHKYLNGLIPYEIIIVDNNSSDNTQDVLKKEKIKYIKNSANFGFAKANNIGVKQSKGDYLLFLNSDMELIDDSLIKMLNFFKKDETIGIIGPQFLNIDKTPQASVFPPQTILNAFKEFWLGQKNAYSKYNPPTDKISQVYAISGGALLIRKTLFNKIGAWNEKYHFYFEDLDMSRTINKLGYKVIFYPFCKVIHRHGASGKKLADPQNQWRRLINGSIKYHGYFKNYILYLIIKSSQVCQKYLNK